MTVYNVGPVDAPLFLIGAVLTAVSAVMLITGLVTYFSRSRKLGVGRVLTWSIS